MFTTFPVTFTTDGRKVPIKEVKWREEATTDQNIISNWSNLHAHKIKAWGIPTGISNGLLVLDVDVKDNGFETVKKYHLPLTLSQDTKSGGKHYIYKYPQDGHYYANRQRFDSGLDIRGEGGYICHYGLDSTPIAEAPDWLVQASLSVKKEVSGNIAQVSHDICQAILEKACENIRNAPEGEGNEILNIEAYNVGQIIHSMDPEQAYNTLFNAAKERGRPDYECKATINSGFKGGGENAFTSPFDNNKPILTIPEMEEPTSTRWTPSFFTRYDLTNFSKLKKPQLFKNWSTEDIHITTADGGTGKTTLKLVEAIHLALGEDFLGFECLAPARTLFITGEDTAEKLGAMLGAILKQMGILDDYEKTQKVLGSIIVKKDADLCLIEKGRNGFITMNTEALKNVMEAIEDFRPKLIVFDPISSFWGSESALNDMSKAVIKFVGALVEASDACVEIINHMGKQSSSTKDMSQFAGRGGTGLPSHARVSRSLRPLFEEEYQEMTGLELPDGQSAMLCNVNKFSDGSPLYNKPFIIIREGYLFSKVTLVEKKIKEEQNKMSDNERIFTFVKDERNASRFPNKNVIIGHFLNSSDKISKERITRALAALVYTGHMGEKFKTIDNPNVETGGKAFTITDLEGKES